MKKTFVTIGIPIYKRLNYLPHVLSLVRAQDYPFNDHAVHQYSLTEATGILVPPGDVDGMTAALVNALMPERLHTLSVLSAKSAK